MQEVRDREVRNWFGCVVQHPAVVVYPETIHDIVVIMRDRERYPSPVRAIGANHSVSACGVADRGTLVVMDKMSRILYIGTDVVAAQAGARYIDIAQELRKHDRQFYVNVEIGNLSCGSAACGGTKDASMPGEYGQVASYVTAVRMVTPDGEVIDVTQVADPDLLRVVRSSYGLLGILVEVTFKVRPLRQMEVHHELYRLEDFISNLPTLTAGGDSLMMYFDPFRDAVCVERRRYRVDSTSRRASRWQWWLRNGVWGSVGPFVAAMATKYIGHLGLRYFLLNRFYGAIFNVVSTALRGRRTIPTDQMIRYHDQATASGYIFSIWAFDESGYSDKLRDYFEFCRSYFRDTGYRPNLVSVGYRILHDESSLFSYSYRGNVITFDPVFTGNPGWEDFIDAYNRFCSARDGLPLFNQSPQLTRDQVRKAFGERLDEFHSYRRRLDPTDRLFSQFFRDILSCD